MIGPVFPGLGPAVRRLAIGLELLAQGVLLLRQLFELFRRRLLGLLAQLDRLVENELDLRGEGLPGSQRILLGAPGDVSAGVVLGAVAAALVAVAAVELWQTRRRGP